MKNSIMKIGVAQMVVGVAMLFTVGVFAFAFQVSTAEAVSTMRLPLSSDPGINAWFDHQAGSGFKKYTCSTSGSYDGHEGTDFPTWQGRTIYAGADGSLYYRYDGCANSGSWGCGSGFGNHVRLEHAVDDLVSIYAHMKNGTPRWYSTVSCVLGATVGQVASSGNSSDNHLHLELWKDRYNSYEIDPFSGSCSQATSYWTNQGSGSPTTQCQ